MTQPPGEIITLQLGSFANYVGAHYWNLQVRVVRGFLAAAAGVFGGGAAAAAFAASARAL